ncbi:MAG: nucleotide sugar dehydrogenase [Candidatus Omnitrophota bacterium]
MNNAVKEFNRRVKSKKLLIAVVGLGYVGLPLAMQFSRKGFRTLGIEIDRDRLNRLKKRQSYISDVRAGELKKVVASGNFVPCGEFSALREADAVIICVPTPLKRKYHPDISYIREAVRGIGRNIKKGTLVVLESTTYPGTTEEVILPLLEKGGLRHNRDFYLSFSPERIDPGNKTYPVGRIPKIVGGVSSDASLMTVALYRSVISNVIPVSSARTAEAVKLLENTFRLINIALIDEIAMMAHKMGIDVWEVIRGASTKPFGFMPFYPGPGVGGHCLSSKETVCVKEGNALKVMAMPDLIKHLESSPGADSVEVLSFDPMAKKGVFKRVTAASARPYSGEMINIVTEDGRHLRVTNLHPMFIYHDGKWRLRYARDLRPGDSLPICLNLPFFNDGVGNAVDLIEEIQRQGRWLIDKVRVEPLDFSWRDYAGAIKDILRRRSKGGIPDCCWDYLSDNKLPLRYFYELDKFTAIDHRRLKLVTGRGPSRSSIPAVIELDSDFCRLIGYYLSEGCYTKDKSARIRFSFNRCEKDYIEDVKAILARLGIRASVYESRAWYSSCLKVSSDIFGFLLYKVLGCGRNCYDMKIPSRLFSFDSERKRALVSGLFRGDGSVEHFFGKWRYRRNEKEYLHNVNTANISFFTSSRKLFQQLIILLHDLGIVCTFRKRKYSLSIFGWRQLEFFKDFFAGKKKEIILRYLELNKNRPRNKTFRKFENFATVKVRSTSVSKGGWVYSIETEKPHAFVTSYGIAVHNCIPKDPLYLYWKARHYGFRSRFIRLASDTISGMPQYITERVMHLLKHKAASKSKVLVIGATYKKDIKDLRQSPALDIISAFHRRGVLVSYYDPLIPYLKINGINLKGIRLNSANLKGFDCVVIATDHSALDYSLILKNSRLIFDTRNAYARTNNPKVVRL